MKIIAKIRCKFWYHIGNTSAWFMNWFEYEWLFDLYQYSMWKSSLISDQYHLEIWYNKNTEKHICKYCGAEVTSPDEECYKNYKQ